MSGPSSSEAALIAKYLGPDASGGGPFSILGLRPDAFEDRDVLIALRTRLDQTVAHPQGRTPEADEVRLALHAAAAQLLDPRAREGAMRQWAQPSGVRLADSGASRAAQPLAHTSHSSQPSTSGPIQPQRPFTPSPTPRAPINAPPSAHDPDSLVTMQVQHDMLMAIAACGGWNSRAMRRVVSTAHMRGVPIATVTRAIRTFSPRTPHTPSHSTSPLKPHTSQPTPAWNTGAASPSPHARTTNPAGFASQAQTPPLSTPVRRRAIPTPLLLAAAAVIGGSLLILGSVSVYTALSRSKAAPLNNTQAGLQGQSPGTDSSDPDALARDTDGQLFRWQGGSRSASSDSTPTPPVGTTTDAARVARELQLSIQALSIDPEAALPRVLSAINETSRTWPRMEPPELASAVASIVELFYTVSDPSQVDALLVAISEPAESTPESTRWTRDRVVARCWAIGILTRLGREKNLPFALIERIDRALMGALQGTRPIGDPPFDVGLLEALQSLSILIESAPSGQAESATAWDGWIQAASAAAKLQPARATDIWISGLDALLPQADKPGAQDRIERLVTNVRWQSNQSAQRWLMARFDSLDTRREAITSLTRALASKSSVPGIDITMVLSPAATEADRRLLRQRYADAIGFLNAKDSDSLAETWNAHAERALTRAARAQTVIDRLAALSEAAAVNDAAWLRWRGSFIEASDALGRSNTTLDTILATQNASPNSNAPLRRDTPPQWAPRYIGAGSEIPTRLALINDLGRESIDLHPADAEVLLNDALRGTPVQVRDAARDAVIVRASSPVMVNAMLEALPTAPRIRSVAEIIGSLTLTSRFSIDAETWRIEARRLLVERLLALMADRGPMRIADDLVAVVARAYESRAALTPLSTKESSGLHISEDPGRDAQLHVARTVNVWWTIAADLQRPRDFPLPLTDIQSRRAARLAVASGSIQGFVAEQIALTELMAYVIVAEQPSSREPALAILDDLTERVRGSTHVVSQSLDAELAMMRLWSLRFEPQELPPPTEDPTLPAGQEVSNEVPPQ